jgi:cell division protein FtsB
MCDAYAESPIPPIPLQKILMTRCYTEGLMPYKDAAPFPKQMTIVIGLAVVGLMAFGLALSYYKNILFDQQLLSMQVRNAKLKAEITDGYQHFEYLKSDQYKDKYAKENLGLLRPGEKVLLIDRPTNVTPLTRATDLTEDEKIALFEENLRNIRIIDQWRLYLFHREKIEDLRRAL